MNDLVVASINVWGEPPNRNVRAEAAGRDVSGIVPAVVVMQEMVNPDQTSCFLRGLNQGGETYHVIRGPASTSQRSWWCWVPTLVLLLLMLLVSWIFKTKSTIITSMLLIAILAGLLSPPSVRYIGFKILGFDFKSQLAFAVREPIKVAEIYHHHSFSTKGYPPPTHMWSWLVWWFAEASLSPGFAAVRLEVPTPTGQKALLCYNLHLTPGRQNPIHAKQCAELLLHLKHHCLSDTSVIVAGDFNDISSDSLVGTQLRSAGFQLHSSGKPSWTQKNSLTSQGAFGNPDPDGDIDQIWTRGLSSTYVDLLAPKDGELQWSDHHAPWAKLVFDSL